MKPLHIGLLVVGAALAGGLALKMAEPVPVPIPVAAPVSQPVRHTVVTAPPVAVSVPAAKPSPMPPAPKRASAPSPVYDEPAKPAIRKNKPISIARLTVATKPSPWRPGPYHAPAQPSTAPAVAEQSAEPALLPAIEPSPVVEKSVEKVVEKAPPPPPRHVTLRPGMAIPVRLDEALSSDKSLGGDTFQASLAEPLVVDGLVIAEKGARVSGRVVDSQKARNTGIAILQLGLASVTTSDGQQVAISTDPWMRNGDTSRPADAGTIAGGVAAAGTVAAVRGRPANVPAETIIRFRLASRVTVTEQQVASR